MFLSQYRHWQLRRVRVAQSDISDCGPASLKSVAAYYRVHASMQYLRQHAGTHRGGTHMQGMTEAATALGLNAKAGKAGIDLLRQIDRPVILMMRKGPLLHYLVYYPDTSFPLLMDPSDGRLVRVDWKRIEADWTGILQLMEPAESLDYQAHPITSRKLIIDIVLENRQTLMLCVLYALLFTLLGLCFPVYLKIILDRIIPDGNSGLMDQLSLLMLGILLLSIGLSWKRGILGIRMGIAIDKKLTLGYFDHLLRLPQQFFDSMRTGEIMARVGDATRIRAFVADSLMALMINLLIIVSSFGLMWYYSPRLTSYLFILIPVYAIIFSRFNQLFSFHQKKVMENWAGIESFWLSSLNSIETLRFYNLQDQASRDHRSRYEKLLEANYSVSRYGLLNLQWTEFLSRLSILFLLWMGVKMVMTGELSLGSLLSFYALVGYFHTPLQNIMSVNRVVQSAKVAAERLIDLQSTARLKTGNEIAMKDMFPVEIKSLCFRYPGSEMLLKNVSLTVERGEFVLLRGKSGSGKSTLFKVLTGNYFPSSGKVSFAGQIGISDSIIQHMGYAPQFPQILPRTLAENICMGSEPDLQQMNSMVEEFQLHEFLKAFPFGLSTYLGEGGMELSGGQKQMIALMRIIYRRPQWVLLDEPVSMMDSETSKVFDEMILRWKECKTAIFMISHDEKWINHAGRILEIADGEVNELILHGK